MEITNSDMLPIVSQSKRFDREICGSFSSVGDDGGSFSSGTLTYVGKNLSRTARGLSLLIILLKVIVDFEIVERKEDCLCVGGERNPNSLLFVGDKLEY